MSDIPPEPVTEQPSTTKPIAPPDPELKILSHKETYKCSRFGVNETKYQIGTDEPRVTYKIQLIGDLLVVIPRFKQKIVLVGEIQPPSTDVRWGFPTGFIVSGMGIADTAQSILLDKTGLAAQKFHVLGSFHPSRYMDNIVHVMAADGLTRQKDQAPNDKDKLQLLTEQEIGLLLIQRSIDDGLALASYAYYATSNYFAEVHHGPDHPDNTRKPQ